MPDDATERVSIDIFEQIEWQTAVDVFAICLNCGDAANKRIILRSPSPNARSPESEISLIQCQACGCSFVHPIQIANYLAEPVGGEWALAFYLQQGAGLKGITSNLSELNQPVGTRFLEVGCGFGFGLDFARRTLGWSVLGLDPSPFAAAGRARHGFPIKPRYLVADDPDLDGGFDVIMASEVIEHVASPINFARTLRAALRDGGSLVLTTPDVGAVEPTTPRGILVPLLSIGHHVVLQSKASLTALLLDAGFEDVCVRRAGAGQLLGRCRAGSVTRNFATERPISDSHDRKYREYLRDAAEAAEGDSDLWLGLTARAYREAVNAVDLAAADSLWDAFSAACNRRFGFSPEAGPDVTIHSTCRSLENLARLEPLCLGPVLLHRAFHRLHSGEKRTAVQDLFRRAADTCGQLRLSLQQIGSDDGDAEDVAWVAGAEEILCAAERGDKDVPQRFDALGPSPSDVLVEYGRKLQRTKHYRRRIFVSLVNAARLEEADLVADVVIDAEESAAVTSALLADDELDVLFCAAMRELQRLTGGAERALGLLRLLKAACTVSRGESAQRLAALARDKETLALKNLRKERTATNWRSRLARAWANR